MTAAVVDIQYVRTLIVHCDGNGESGGHPRVFLHLVGGDKVVCPYCSRTFMNMAKDKATS